MTISSETCRVAYDCDGTLNALPVPFYFLADSDLLVIATNRLTGVETELILNTNYTVSGAGDPAGGAVTPTAARGGEYYITIIRDPDHLQQTDYTRGDPFSAESHERALDKLTMLVQRLYDKAAHFLQTPETSNVDSVAIIADIYSTRATSTANAATATAQAGIATTQAGMAAASASAAAITAAEALTAKYVWKGGWSNATAYVIRDFVQKDGSAYVAIAANTNQAPPNITYWDLVASKGSDGAAGAGTGDASTNTSSSADGQLAAFFGSAGKTLKQCLVNGIAFLTNGVVSTATGPQIVAAIGSSAVANATYASSAGSAGSATSASNLQGYVPANFAAAAHSHSYAPMTAVTAIGDVEANGYCTAVRANGSTFPFRTAM